MICNPKLNDGAVDSPLVAHIAGQLDSLCGPELALQEGQVQEVARAVETFLVHEQGDGLVDSTYLVVLASRTTDGTITCGIPAWSALMRSMLSAS